MAGHAATRVKPDAKEVPNAPTNRKVLAFVNELRKLPPVEMDDPQAIQERVDYYFDMCEQHGLKLQVNGFASAFKTNMKELNAIIAGEKSEHRGHAVLPECRIILADAMNVFPAYAEASLNEKNTNPAGDIFLLKNHFGYKDAQEKTSSSITINLPQVKAGESAAKKYAELVGVEVPETFSFSVLPSEG